MVPVAQGEGSVRFYHFHCEMQFGRLGIVPGEFYSIF